MARCADSALVAARAGPASSRPVSATRKNVTRASAARGKAGEAACEGMGGSLEGYRSGYSCKQSARGSERMPVVEA